MITEKISGKIVATKKGSLSAKRDNITEVAVEIPLPEFIHMDPESPFLV